MATLCIEGDLTIYTAAAQKDRLLAFLGTDGDLELDLADVTELDGAGLQLVLLACREAAASGRRILCTKRSPVVHDVLLRAHLDASLGGTNGAASETGARR